MADVGLNILLFCPHAITFLPTIVHKLGRKQKGWAANERPWNTLSRRKVLWTLGNHPSASAERGGFTKSAGETVGDKKGTTICSSFAQSSYLLKRVNVKNLGAPGHGLQPPQTTHLNSSTLKVADLIESVNIFKSEYCTI